MVTQPIVKRVIADMNITRRHVKYADADIEDRFVTIYMDAEVCHLPSGQSYLALETFPPADSLYRSPRKARRVSVPWLRANRNSGGSLQMSTHAKGALTTRSK